MIIYKFRTYEHIEPHYKCNQPGDNTGEYVALADYEALAREVVDLRRRLEIALEIATNNHQEKSDE